ncbi:hypothetical protein EF906_25960 [Streptomyces sp. WAC08241]|nr:hypothetical protein EF906_25960 [Streptomyces sp. WAC08241]
MSDRADGRVPEQRPGPEEYEGEGITVTFEPCRCPRAAECVHGLPEVFATSRRPWVLSGAAAPDRVAGGPVRLRSLRIPAVPRSFGPLLRIGRRAFRTELSRWRKGSGLAGRPSR